MRISYKIAKGLAAAGGLGWSPLAPGTFGTLGGILLHLISFHWDFGWRLLFWFAVAGLGIFSIVIINRTQKTGDAGWIVIDEVVGFGVAAWTSGFDQVTIGVAFMLFRVFDIWKPFPIRNLDQWSKSRTNPWSSAIGILLDDCIAGGLALTVIVLLQRGGIL